MPRGTSPASLANLRRGNVSTKKRPPKPVTNSPAHMNMMNAARRAKREARETAAREFPILTREVVEHVPVAPRAERALRADEVGGSNPSGRATPPEMPPETPAEVAPPPPVEVPRVEETEGERRCRLYERDYALVMAGKPLPVDPPSTFPRHHRGAGRIDWVALGL